MKLLLPLIFILSLMSSCAQDDTTTFYLLRHAEKQNGSDPDLTSEGEERAQYYASRYAEDNVLAVLTTDTRRTRNTATPIAEKHGLELEVYDPSQLDIGKLARSYSGGTVIIIGHSNTIAEHTNQALGDERYDEVDLSDYDTYFKVNVSGDEVTAERKAFSEGQ